LKISNFVTYSNKLQWQTEPYYDSQYDPKEYTFMSLFILFRHRNRKYGHTTRSSFLATCFGSLSHHQVFDFFISTSIRLIVIIYWAVFTYWYTGF
jgi:hypothetical protein